MRLLKVPSVRWLKTPFIFTLIALAAFANVSCDSIFGDLYPPSDVYYYEAPTPAEAQSMAKNATVECETFGSCPPSVGLLTGNMGSEAYQCTTFLVAPQIAITNSHCIPQELTVSGSDCSNRIWLHFPETSQYESVSANCSRVIQASDLVGLHMTSQGEAYDKIQPDFAVIELDRPVNRPTLSISRAGFQNGHNYTINKVDPNGYNHIRGEVSSIQCTAEYSQDATAAQYNSSNIYFSNCDVYPGNSGAPILDDDGAVRGVVQAISVPKDALSQAQDPVQKFELIAKAPRIGTNFACLDLPTAAAAPVVPAACGVFTAAK